MTARCLLFCLIALTAGLPVAADRVHLRCTADTCVSSYESERDFNYGHSARLRLKGIEMLGLLQFDTVPVHGWKVDRATLFLRYAGAERKLRTLGFSTVSAPWQEGTGSAEKKPGETCFNWEALGQTRWAGAGTDFTDVSFTAGHTLAAYSDVHVGEDGWISAPVDPRIVQAMVSGVSYGMAVSDEKGQTAANNDVYSREQGGSEPYLVVDGHPVSEEAPRGVTGLTARPDGRHADFRTGSIEISFVAPDGAFSYEVSMVKAGMSADVPRSSIPLAKPGERQSIVLASLDPNGSFEVAIAAVGSTGARGVVARVAARSSAARVQPDPLRRPAAIVPHAAALQTRPFRVWAYPDTEKAHPVSGNVLEEVGSAAYAGRPTGNARAVNAVWDGHTIILSAARNEFVAFHLLIEAIRSPLKDIAVTGPAPFRAPPGTRAWSAVSGLFRDWYVRDGDWFPEICVPLKGTLNVPALDNMVPGQRNQSVLAEFLVPRAAPPGLYRSTITVAVPGASPVPIPIELTVNALTLPDRLSFDVSLNGYGTVGGPFGLDDRTAEYRALERECHRMAHAHRSTLALLGYSHAGSITSNYAPPLEGTGANLHVRDWSAWDAQFGPYLDGSAFEDLPRRGVPITHFYLPFHEAWPVDIRQHYAYRQNTSEYPEIIAEHAMNAPPIEQAVDKELADGFTTVARQFAEHFRAKGWTHTQFQFYQNDKHYYKDPKQGGRGTSWWLLDEPNHRDDWLALAYFARLWRAGIGINPGVSMVHREDISRPQWQRDYLDGLVDLMVVSGELYTKGPRLREMSEKLGVKLWNYGSANPVRRSNTEAEAWAVRAWLANADGIVPWQTIGADENYARPDETALLLPGKRFGIVGPVASLRLKALRRAQQDVEYLVLLAKAHGWDRAQTAAALSPLLKFDATFHQANKEDAGSYRFGAMRAGDFSDARKAAAASVGLPH